MEAGHAHHGSRVGALARVKCRVCKQDVNFQYYKEHLKSRHPGEDEKDLRGFGQPKLFEVSINKKRKLDDSSFLSKVGNFARKNHPGKNLNTIHTLI